jgi:hypothetical protein
MRAPAFLVLFALEMFRIVEITRLQRHHGQIDDLALESLDHQAQAFVGFHADAFPQLDDGTEIVNLVADGVEA